MFADGGYAGPKLRGGALRKVAKFALQIVKRPTRQRASTFPHPNFYPQARKVYVY
jgi:hypothetical protein